MLTMYKRAPWCANQSHFYDNGGLLPNIHYSMGGTRVMISPGRQALKKGFSAIRRTGCADHGANRIAQSGRLSAQIGGSRATHDDFEVLVDVASTVADCIQLPLKLRLARNCRLLVEQQLLVHLLQVETLALDFDQALQHCRFGFRQLRRIARFHGSFRQIDGVLQTGDGCGHGRNVHLVPRLVVGRARSRLNHLSACALTVRAGRAAA